ncbi:IclR family transcriptional regulator [Streptomyces lydicus]|uniref:hypothetical protein n=1 Tax=Streptomyces lydicus TaxID=47763 RepID=UPI0036E0425C
MIPLHREPPPEALNPYKPLAAMLHRGPGPHGLSDLAARTGLPRLELRGHLAAMTKAGLCTATPGMPGYYELAMPAPADDASWLVHALPGTPDTHADPLRELHRSTGQPVLLHSHILLPTALRLCVDFQADEAPDFLQQMATHPNAAGRLKQARLDADAPGLVIRAHLDTFQPATAELQRVRTHGYAVTAAPLPGWSLLSVPVHRPPEDLGLLEYARPPIAGALSLVVRTPDLDAHHLPWLTALHHGSRSLSHTMQPTPAATRPVLRAA